jgi:hypothetical protein
VTCGAQFAPSTEPPSSCLICLDERQYVGHDGQQWTTLADLCETHQARVEQIEPGLVAIGIEPEFAIGQRALLLSGVLWDCVPPVEDEIERVVAATGESARDGDGAGGTHGRGRDRAGRRRHRGVSSRR